MKNINAFICLTMTFMSSGCVSTSSYLEGSLDYPDDFQYIVIDHVIKSFENTSNFEIQFINIPKKQIHKNSSQSELGVKYGYGVCAYVKNGKSSEPQLNWFLIRDNKVIDDSLFSINNLDVACK